MRPYRPSHRVTTRGLLLTAVTATIGGVMVGVLGTIAAQLYYIIIVFALGMALAGAALMRRAIKRGQMRNAFVGALLGLLMGVVVYGSYQYVDYFLGRREVINSIVQEYQVDNASAAQAVDEWLAEESGLSGFLGFMEMRARSGETFTTYLLLRGLVVEKGPFTLQAGWAWLHWIVEALLVVMVLTAVGYNNAAQPFCESGPGWYKEWSTGIARVEGARIDEFLAALQAGDYHRASQFVLPEERVEHPTLEIYVQRCIGWPAADVLLTLQQAIPKGGGVIKRKLVLRGEVTAMEYDTLTRGLSQETGLAEEALG